LKITRIIYYPRRETGHWSVEEDLESRFKSARTGTFVASRLFPGFFFIFLQTDFCYNLSEYSVIQGGGWAGMSPGAMEIKTERNGSDNMWLLVIIVTAILGGVISDYLKHQRKMEKLKLDHIDKEIELERLKQENFLLENEEMRTVLDRIKADNKRLATEKDSKWLIQETRERQLEEREG
jgi:hypothetical protein